MKMLRDAAKFWKGKKMLVVSPHPDDEVFGCGGTMAKAKALGCRVYLLIFSVGDLKFYEKKKKFVRAKERLSELSEVAKILKLDGMHVVYQDAKTHMRLDSIPRRDLVNVIESESPIALDRIRPDIFAIPAPSYNQDHEAVFKACFTAARIHAGGTKASPETVLVYESPTLSWIPEGGEFHPNFYVDISDYLKIRSQLVRAYVSQQRHPNDPTSFANLEDLARLRGRQVGRGACEAFRAYRIVV